MGNEVKAYVKIEVMIFFVQLDKLIQLKICEYLNNLDTKYDLILLTKKPPIYSES